MIDMATKKKPTEDQPKTPFPSRGNYKGTYLPKRLYEELAEFADEGERSVAYLVRKAVQAYLVELRAKAERA